MTEFGSIFCATSKTSWEFDGGQETPRTLVLKEEGSRVGLVKPDGTKLILGQNDIVIEIDQTGHVTSFPVGQTPEGYQVMTEQELAEIDPTINRPEILTRGVIYPSGVRHFSF